MRLLLSHMAPLLRPHYRLCKQQQRLPQLPSQALLLLLLTPLPFCRKYGVEDIPVVNGWWKRPKPAVRLQTATPANMPSLFFPLSPHSFSHTAPSWLLGMLLVTLNPSSNSVSSRAFKALLSLVHVINIYFLNTPNGGSIPLHLNHLKPPSSRTCISQTSGSLSSKHLSAHLNFIHVSTVQWT